MKIKNVIFDLDGVIRGIRNTPINDILPSNLKSLYSKDFENVGLCDFVAKYISLSCFKEWDKGLVTKDEVLKHVLDVALEPAEIVKTALNSVLEPRQNIIYKETTNFIKVLKEKGYNVYLLSNMCKEIVEILATILDVHQFKDCLFSCDVGLRKPDLEFYKYALKKWSIKAEESIFIDDSIKNLKPFEMLGGEVYQFDATKIDLCIQEIQNILLESEND